MPIIDLPLSFRFGVFFFMGGFLGSAGRNEIDIRFQRVSGLVATVSMKTHTEGGQNLYAHHLPEAVGYQNLVLERSAPLISPLSIEFNTTLSLFKFRTSDVLVTLYDDHLAPLAGWMFLKAYPVRWATSDLDATQNSVVIDTLELAYTRMQIMRL